MFVKVEQMFVRDMVGPGRIKVDSHRGDLNLNFENEYTVGEDGLMLDDAGRQFYLEPKRSKGNIYTHHYELHLEGSRQSAYFVIIPKRAIEPLPMTGNCDLSAIKENVWFF